MTPSRTPHNDPEYSRFWREVRRKLWNPRPSQQTPPGSWTVWLILAGRGWGKTRTGAEDVKAFGLNNPGSRIAVVAPTFSDARDTCIEGESGLRTILRDQDVQAWNRSLGELILTNGTRYKLFSADEPDRMRGPQHHRAWCDELASWTYPDAWDQLQFGLRLGDDPRTIVTTTPKPVHLVRDLLKRDDVTVTTGSTFENAANLAPAALASLKARYANTRLGQQELYAQVLDEMEGALWKRHMIHHWPDQDLPEMVRTVIAIDPAVTSGENSDETGIVAVGRGTDGRAYVLADVSGRMSPRDWASAAVNLYRHLEADRIVAEVNNGGDMVEMTIRTVAPNVPYTAVRASRGKLTRAEPIAALYEQGKVFHALAFADLEDQLCNYVPQTSQTSPDRLDALVWAMTELMLDGQMTTGEPMMIATHRTW